MAGPFDEEDDDDFDDFDNLEEVDELDACDGDDTDEVYEPDVEYQADEPVESEETGSDWSLEYDDGKRWIDDQHYVVVSDDGRESTTYRTGFFMDEPVEHTDHYEDGTSQAYEHDYSWKGPFFGGRGKAK
jgi:hypothetical protein